MFFYLIKKPVEKWTFEPFYNPPEWVELFLTAEFAK